MTRSTAELRQYLAGEWLFDNDFQDTSGNGNHGIPTDIEWKPTLRGLKPKFNGSSSKVDCGNNSSLDITDTYTIGIWVRLIKYDNYRDIVGKAASSENRINIEIGDDGTILGYMRTGNVAQVAVKTDVIAAGEWNHLVYTIDTTNQLAKIYQNGVLKNTDTSFTLPTTTSADFAIGHRGTDGSYSNIIVSECINYNIALTATEVLNLYNETKGEYGVMPAEHSFTHNPDDVIDASGAVGAWGTAKESTTKLVDLSGNGNIATINGAMPTEGFIQGRRFDGDNDYLDCGNGYAVGTEDMTVFAIVKPLSVYIKESTSDKCICSNGNAEAGVSYPGWKLHWDYYQGWVFKATDGDGEDPFIKQNLNVDANLWTVLFGRRNTDEISLYVDGTIYTKSASKENVSNTRQMIGTSYTFVNTAEIDAIIPIVIQFNRHLSDAECNTIYNTLARLPFWSIDYEDYPDNVTTYTDRLPYSSSIISSGTFKVDDDVLNCVSAGTITYRASYEFDGSEYIKVEIDGVEYAGTGTITQGNTTVSVAQGSNKITIAMGTADTINKVRIQFREEV